MSVLQAVANLIRLTTPPAKPRAKGPPPAKVPAGMPDEDERSARSAEEADALVADK